MPGSCGCIYPFECLFHLTFVISVITPHTHNISQYLLLLEKLILQVWAPKAHQASLKLCICWDVCQVTHHAGRESAMSRGGCVICVIVLGALFMSSFLAPQILFFFCIFYWNCKATICKLSWFWSTRQHGRCWGQHTLLVNKQHTSILPIPVAFCYELMFWNVTIHTKPRHLRLFYVTFIEKSFFFFSADRRSALKKRDGLISVIYSAFLSYLPNDPRCGIAAGNFLRCICADDFLC